MTMVKIKDITAETDKEGVGPEDKTAKIDVPTKLPETKITTIKEGISVAIETKIIEVDLVTGKTTNIVV